MARGSAKSQSVVSKLHDGTFCMNELTKSAVTEIGRAEFRTELTSYFDEGFILPCDIDFSNAACISSGVT